MGVKDINDFIVLTFICDTPPGHVVFLCPSQCLLEETNCSGCGSPFVKLVPTPVKQILLFTDPCRIRNVGFQISKLKCTTYL